MSEETNENAHATENLHINEDVHITQSYFGDKTLTRIPAEFLTFGSPCGEIWMEHIDHPGVIQSFRLDFEGNELIIIFQLLIPLEKAAKQVPCLGEKMVGFEQKLLMHL